LNANLLFPKIESDVSIPEQLQQMKSYLFQFREQIELLLMNIDSDNISGKFKDDFSELVGSKIMNGKEMSQIIQSAGAIRLQVEELGGSVASLELTTSGIYQQINDPDSGVLARLAVDESGISASVKKGTNYSGVSISSTGISISSTGSVSVNADVIVNGTITASKFQKSGTGYSILGDCDLGDITVNNIVTLGSSCTANFFTTEVTYLNASRNITATQNISCGGSMTVGSTLSAGRVETLQLELNGEDVGIYTVPDGLGNRVAVLGVGYIS